MRYVVLDCSAVTGIDATAARACFLNLAQLLKPRGVTLVLAVLPATALSRVVPPSLSASHLTRFSSNAFLMSGFSHLKRFSSQAVSPGMVRLLRGHGVVAEAGEEEGDGDDGPGPVGLCRVFENCCDAIEFCEVRRNASSRRNASLCTAFTFVFPPCKAHGASLPDRMRCSRRSSSGSRSGALKEMTQPLLHPPTCRLFGCVVD